MSELEGIQKEILELFDSIEDLQEQIKQVNVEIQAFKEVLNPDFWLSKRKESKP
jgi:peptidoglycan hydrolase CwlO-like protein